VQAVSLWDPSFNLPALWKLLDYRKIMDLYLIRFDGKDSVVGNAMVEEGTVQYDAEECLALSEKWVRPIQVINAEYSEEAEVYKSDPRSWHSAGSPLNQRILINGAEHNFWQGSAINELIEHSSNWFAKSFDLSRA
jgi:hypothetical protein